MSAFASSVINKSGKKLVPKKAPPRKAARTTTSKPQPTIDPTQPPQPQSPQQHSAPSSETHSIVNIGVYGSRSNERSITPITSTRTNGDTPTTTATKVPDPASNQAKLPSRNQVLLYDHTPVTECSSIPPGAPFPASSISFTNRSKDSNEAIKQRAAANSGSEIRRSQRLLHRPQKPSSTNKSILENQPLKNRPRPPAHQRAPYRDQDRSVDARAARFSRSQSSPATRSDSTMLGKASQHLTSGSVTSDDSLSFSPSRITHAEADGSNSKSPGPQRHISKRKRETQPTKEIGRESVADTHKNRSKRAQGGTRRSIPETTEQSEIEPSRATLSDLCRDTGHGKKSKRESLLESIDWDAVKRRKQEERDREVNGNAQALTDRDATPQLLGPQMRIVNDEFVLDEATQVIDEHARIIEEANVEGDALDESSLTKPVNQATVGRQKTRSGIRWDEENTEKFYEGLRMFGTDLLMIGNQLFEGISRQHLKRKFVKEEHEHPDRLRRALLRSREAQGNSLQAIRKIDYEDPGRIYAELAALEKSLEEEYAKEQEENANGGRRKKKRRQDQVAETPEAEKVRDRSSKENQTEEDTRRRTEEANINKRGKTAGSNRKRNQKHKVADVGTEEILGSVEDIQ